MILSDETLNQRLSEFKICTTHSNYVFDPQKQIKQCSIDLRLSDIAWKPKRFHRIDLRDNTPTGPQITRAFKRIRLSENKGYMLRPGEFLLGRTYESFEIPSDLAGLLRGRSSFGRLGLSVVGPSSTINPGWRGHMPLMIINHSKFAIRIHPYLSMVQLFYCGLTTPALNLYGSATASSKYQEDDAGPSRYWLDESVQAIQKLRIAQKATPEIEASLTAFASRLDEPTRLRFGTFIKKYGSINDAKIFTESFIDREGLRPAIAIALGVILTFTLGALWRLVLPHWNTGIIGKLFVLGWCLLIVALLSIIFVRHLRTRIGVAELRRFARDERIS